MQVHACLNHCMWNPTIAFEVWATNGQHWSAVHPMVWWPEEPQGGVLPSQQCDQLWQDQVWCCIPLEKVSTWCFKFLLFLMHVPPCVRMSNLAMTQNLLYRDYQGMQRFVDYWFGQQNYWPNPDNFHWNSYYWWPRQPKQLAHSITSPNRTTHTCCCLCEGTVFETWLADFKVVAHSACKTYTCLSMVFSHDTAADYSNFGNVAFEHLLPTVPSFLQCAVCTSHV